MIINAISILSVQSIFFICYLLIVRYNFQNDKKYFYILNGITIVTLFIINYFYFYELKLLHNIEENYTIQFSLFSTMLMFLLGYILKSPDPSKSLRSKTKDDSFFSIPQLKDVKSIKNRHISTYPRFTFFEGKEERFIDRKVIFDSSDFEIINSIFRANEGYQETLIEGRTIFIKNREFEIQSVQVDFLCVFDDYKLNGHTDVYCGMDTPYNIQIIVHVKQIYN